MKQPMKTTLTDVAVSMSALKKNPAAVLREVNNHPVAVLTHNRVAFYMVEPNLFEAMLEELAGRDLYRKAASRLAQKARAIEVDLDDL